MAKDPKRMVRYAGTNNSGTSLLFLSLKAPRERVLLSEPTEILNGISLFFTYTWFHIPCPYNNRIIFYKSNFMISGTDNISSRQEDQVT